MAVAKKKRKEKAGEGGWALSSSIADQVSFTWRCSTQWLLWAESEPRWGRYKA